TLKYKPQRSELGAAYAIANKIGDCTEYAALTAALCRANGIPARLQAGFGYGGGVWERHAWTEVWLQGFWVPVDSTWYGRDGTLGLTSRHIPLIVGNWMSSRIRQEFNIRWKTRAGEKAGPPELDAKWKVERMASKGSTPGPRLRAAPVRLSVKVPDAVPRGTHLKLGVKVSPIPKAPAALSMMAISAMLSDSEMDRIVALKPIPTSLSSPLNTTIELQMPRCIPKATLSLRVWVDGKPTKATWEKSIGLIQ
ncbi:MAG: transglutaminase-like domain-containing protein, partial [Promethearchaeota archaeon]